MSETYCRFNTLSGCNKLDIVEGAKGDCSLGSSSIKPRCSGGRDETKCWLALNAIQELEEWMRKSMGVKELEKSSNSGF